LIDFLELKGLFLKLNFNEKSIILISHPLVFSGFNSLQLKFKSSLRINRNSVSHHEHNNKSDVILILGRTKKNWLSGIRIIRNSIFYRLYGICWLQKKSKDIIKKFPAF
jgi:hypothetical protein